MHARYPNTKSSPTSPQASTTSAEASRGFWTKSTKAWSKKLWFPTKTALPVLESSSSSPSCAVVGHLSSFSTQKTTNQKAKISSKILQPWSTCSLLGSTEKEGTRTLTKAGRPQRSVAHKDKSTAERETLKQAFEAEITEAKSREFGVN